ncbi:partial nicotinamidase/pyrazinamidase, partial [Anaerolineae bacterium]
GIANYYFPRVSNLVIPNIRKLLTIFRQNEMQVVYLTLGSEHPDGRDMAPLIKHRQAQRRAQEGTTTTFVKGTLEHSVIEELKPTGNDLVINKTSYGAFNSTGMDSILHHLKVKCLVITGVGTDICVETTARDAADRGYNCVLVEDACATFDQISHEATLRVFAKVFGMVKSTDQVITELSS